jgi:hypothetical protein
MLSGRNPPDPYTCRDIGKTEHMSDSVTGLLLAENKTCFVSGSFSRDRAIYLTGLRKLWRDKRAVARTDQAGKVLLWICIYIEPVNGHRGTQEYLVQLVLRTLQLRSWKCQLVSERKRRRKNTLPPFMIYLFYIGFIYPVVTHPRKRGLYVFRRSTISKKITLMMETVRTSETSVYFNETTRRYIPEGSNLYTCRRENLKSYNFWVHVKLNLYYVYLKE